jgi:hypothetical protein
MHTRPLCCEFDVSQIGEPTLDELLVEPTIRMLMSRDGVDEAVLRQLAAEARERCLTLQRRSGLGASPA